MANVALVTWLVTAGVGFFMLVRWLSRGGLRRSGTPTTHFPPARVFTHLALAVAGLAVWIGYLMTGMGLLVWIAFADLVLIALLGGLLVRQWAKDGRVAMAAGPGAAALPDLAEQHIPRGPVVLHGVFAVSTVVLVLLTALGLGAN
jgi:hypothetical protein